MLHVTNGDSAGRTIRDVGLGGDVLPWRDVLHDGPVPAGADRATLREERARWLSGQGWADFVEVLADLAERDARLEAAAASDEEIVLWFEHDLYDQLQLLEILDILAGFPGVEARASLICIDAFPGVERFLGLGQLTQAQMATLPAARQPLGEAQLRLGRAAWAAFRHPDPTRVEDLLRQDTRALPFLAPALARLLEQLPAARTGLSRTEHQIVEGLVAGVRTPLRLFRATQDMEAAPFLGDTSFGLVLAGLAAGERPLLRAEDGGHVPATPARDQWERPLVLTDEGRAVREGRADWVALRGGVDRWLGGVHLHGGPPLWRWDGEVGRVTRT